MRSVLFFHSLSLHFPDQFAMLHKKKSSIYFSEKHGNTNGVDFSLIYWVPVGVLVCTLGLNRDPVCTPFRYPPTPDVETLSIFHLDPPSDYGRSFHRCADQFSFYETARKLEIRGTKVNPEEPLAGLRVLPACCIIRMFMVNILK